MEIREVTAYLGRNIHCHRPMLEAILDLGDLRETDTSALGYFTDRLLAAVPSLADHHCSLGYPGGFVARLREGTRLGHVLEHLALELQSLAGLAAVYGKTREIPGTGLYRVLVESPVPEAAEAAIQAARAMLSALLAAESPDAPAAVAAVRQAAARYGFGVSTAALVAAARSRGIPVLPLHDGSLVQLGYGKHARRLRASLTGQTSCLAVDIAADKALTKQLLAGAGLPVPPGDIADDEEAAVAIARYLEWPVVVKPLYGHQGKGVSLDLNGEEAVRVAYRLALRHGSPVLVESCLSGRHLRVLVVAGRVVAAAERLPACVLGDGRSSILALVEAANRDPRRGEGHEAPLTRIRLDAAAQLYLERQGLTPEAVPLPGQLVFLNDAPNLSAGGTASDVTDRLHKDTVDLCERAATVVGLDVAGVDVVVPAPEQAGAVIIEVNAAPGLRMHLSPSDGEPRDVAGAILDHLFPCHRQLQVPVLAITGTNGKTTTTRMIAQILATEGRCVGSATSDGVFINGRCVYKGDTTGPRSARMVLTDPAVEAAVLETARGGIIRAGLGYDLADVAVVTNISDDHLGQDGVETLHDLMRVKSLVVEAVRPDGAVVLNADDPYVLSMAERASAPVVMFSAESTNLALVKHVLKGGLGLFVKGGYVWAARGEQTERLASVRSIPATLEGRARHNVQNALAAAGAALALGVPRRAIIAGLKGFACVPEINPGRFNIFRLGEVRLVVDYGHNAAAYEAAIRTARQLRPRRLIGVIGVPGDRRDSAIETLGRIAGSGFDSCFLKEDTDRRGRRPGEVAQLLRRGCLAAGMAEGTMTEVLDERQALLQALATAGAGDVVVIFYEYLDAVLAALPEGAEAAVSVAPPIRRSARTAI